MCVCARVCTYVCISTCLHVCLSAQEQAALMFRLSHHQKYICACTQTHILSDMAGVITGFPTRFSLTCVRDIFYKQNGYSLLARTYRTAERITGILS